MKKTLIIAILAIIPTLAFSTTQCINTNVSCSKRYYGNGFTSWITKCGTYNITGMNICSNTAGTTTGEVIGNRYNLTIGAGTSGENVYCWCRMTHPIVSKWVFHYKASSAAECIEYCSSNCSDIVQRNASSVRTVMFNNPEDTN